MKATAFFITSGLMLAVVLQPAAVLSAEGKPNVTTNGSPGLKLTPAAKASPTSQPGKATPTNAVRFDATEVITINRKATLYGLNPNLLQAVLQTELESASTHAKQSESEFKWMTEMTARTLRHCLDKDNNLNWALAFYAMGNFDRNDIDHRALKFSSLARKHFRDLEKAHPWNPQKQANKITKEIP